MIKRFSLGSLVFSPIAIKLLAVAAATGVQADEAGPTAAANRAADVSLEQTVIIGSQDQAKQMAGSAFVIDSTELEKFDYSDIHRILRQVPGVYARQEEGYGLRPNIGIRGAGGDRSAKITLMEDGVLIAPAPYSGPSAYYFPTTARMSSVEILKGAETIQHGPYTVGGAVNLISTPIPAQSSGFVQVEVGEDGEDRLHAWYGDSDDNYGWLVETYQHNADGFKSIDRSAGDTGLDLEDYMAKLRLNTDSDARYYNQLDLKLQYSSETSNQSYLGLTDEDFDQDPNRRYGISDLDQMDNEHAAVSLAHLIVLSDSLSLKTTAYYNDFERDWFKLDGAGSYIEDANAGDAGAQALLDGTRDTDPGELLTVRHNAREYKSYGLQSVLNWKTTIAGMSHDIDAGLRWHEDEVDRFQPVENYSQLNGSLVFDSISDPSSSGNRVEEAEALSVFLINHIAVTERLDVTAGLRYEDVDTEQYRYNDVQRSSGQLTAENSTSDTLLALGATYQLSDTLVLLGGVHEGYAPAGAGSEDVDPEESTNYEAGIRLADGKLFVEAIGFFSDYKNSVQFCTVANPCGIQNSGSIGSGEAEIQGLELLVNYDLSTDAGVSIPVSFTYTYTDTEYTEGAPDDGILAGDTYSDVPENQWAASIGYIAAAGWDAYLNASYVDETCSNTSCDRNGVDDTFLKTSDLLVFDASASYPLNKQATAYVKVDNLLDEQEIVSRRPDGARANKPRTIYLGLKLSF